MEILSETYKKRLQELADINEVKMIDVSCAALGQIIVDEKYLLIKDENSYQPIGGALKFYDSAIPFLKSINFQTDRTDNDLRIKIPEINFEKFKMWFLKGIDRETSINREIEEELTPFLGEMYTKKMKMDDYKTIEANTNKKRMFQIHNIIFKNDVKNAIINLVNKGDEFILASKADIQNRSNGITDHSKYII